MHPVCFEGIRLLTFLGYLFPLNLAILSISIISYAEVIDNPGFAVFADGDRVVVEATPLTSNSRPEMCAHFPDIEIIGCFSGFDGYENALNEIKSHTGL